MSNVWSVEKMAGILISYNEARDKCEAIELLSRFLTHRMTHIFFLRMAQILACCKRMRIFFFLFFDDSLDVVVDDVV